MNFYPLKHLLSYFKYILIRPHRRGHGIHSPFLFDYVVNVINNESEALSIKPVTDLYHLLLRDNSTSNVEDLGAGSGIHRVQERKIKDITRYSSTSVKYGKFLYDTAAYFQPKSILELGTCLGFGTAYLAMACRNAKVVTLEGSKALIEQAQKNYNVSGLENITAVHCNFGDTLSQVLKQNDGFDLIYIDGNHRKEATLSYFAELLPYMKNNSIVIFDDIRWSEEMLEAWNEITGNKRITLSLDLFRMGVVFFNEKLKKQHFQVYY